MKRNSDKLHFLFTLFFCVTLIVVAINSREKSKLLVEKTRELVNERHKYSMQAERVKLKLKMDSQYLKPVELIDSSNKTIPIQDLIKSPKLIFRFFDEFCSACITDVLVSLSELGQEIGHDRIIIISDFETSKLLKLFIRNNRIVSPCFSMSTNFDIDIEKKSGSDKKPYLMILNPNLLIDLPFFADENTENLSVYLEKIIDVFSTVYSSNHFNDKFLTDG